MDAVKRVLLLLVVSACGTPAAGVPDATLGGTDADVPVGEDAHVVAFDDEHVYFGPDDRRNVDKQVTFPAPGLSWRNVTLTITLSCPEGGCDPWDRLAHLSLIGNNGKEIELARFMTPYHVGGTFTLDVTDLQRLLEGEQTVRVFIDTWVGPSRPPGAGWLVDAIFDFQAGVISPEPFAVVPVWAPGGVTYGDPARPTLREATIAVPAGATGARLWTFVTGHGQGNADNCAEFCPRLHTVSVAETTADKNVWRDDCTETAVPDQQGTWEYPRAGWCPGAIVHPWIQDVAAVPAGSVAVTWDVEAYENTCRPDATTCAGCTHGTGCAYDDNGHTEPRFELSGLLVFLR